MWKIFSFPFFAKKDILLIPIPYQEKNNKQVNKDIKSYSFQDYWFLSDLDSHTYPCISSRKDKRITEYDNLDFSKIIIVKEEIGSWYLAGIDSSLSQFESWNVPNHTDNITKEDFDSMLKNNSVPSKMIFLKELSAYYNFDLAVKRNDSLKYFLNKLMN